MTLLGWFFAAGHVVLSHGGAADGGAMHAPAAHQVDQDDDHDGDEPEHDGHHHDLASFASEQFAKAAELRVLAPVFLPLFDMLAMRFTALEREAQDAYQTFDFGESSADERASGWLFVVQTARPVRGPSLI